MSHGNKVRGLLSLKLFQKSLHILNMHRYQLLVELSKWKPLLLLPLQGYLLFLYSASSNSTWRLQCLNGTALEQLASEFNTVGLHSKWETPVQSKLARYLECMYYSIPCEWCATRTLLWSIKVHLRICKNREAALKTDLHLVIHIGYYFRLFLSAAQIRHCIMKKGTNPHPQEPIGVLSIK